MIGDSGYEWEDILQYIERLENAYKKEKSDHEFTKLSLEDTQKNLDDCITLVREMKQETHASVGVHKTQLEGLEDEIKTLKRENLMMKEKLSIITSEKERYKALLKEKNTINHTENTSPQSNPVILKDIPKLEIDIGSHSSTLKVIYLDIIQLIDQFEESKVSDVDFASQMKSLARSFNQKYEEEFMTTQYKMQIVSQLERVSSIQLDGERSNCQDLMNVIKQLQAQNQELIHYIKENL